MSVPASRGKMPLDKKKKNVNMATPLSYIAASPKKKNNNFLLMGYSFSI